MPTKKKVVEKVTFATMNQLETHILLHIYTIKQKSRQICINLPSIEVSKMFFEKSLWHRKKIQRNKVAAVNSLNTMVLYELCFQGLNVGNIPILTFVMLLAGGREEIRP